MRVLHSGFQAAIFAARKTSTVVLLSSVALVGAEVAFATSANAQTHQSGGQGSQTGRGGGGGHDSGHDSTSHSSGGHDSTSHTDGGHDSGGHSGGGGRGGGHDGGQGAGQGHQPLGGQRAGREQPGRDSRSGLPVWAREGIPEVELGRLNVARSPDRVLDRAFLEAQSSFSASTAQFYQLSLDSMISQLSLNWDSVTFIDSPLQNLALLKDSLDGQTVLRDAGITTDIKTLQAVFLGTASDKTIPITPETAIAVTTILGQPLSGAEAEALARDAEKIRVAILAGHG